VERPSPRITEADRAGDVSTLNRKLDRTLYLLIKNKEGRWRFPEDRIYGRENLHQVRIPHLSRNLAAARTDLLSAHRLPNASSSKPSAST
jgi:hypothetical protein